MLEKENLLKLESHFYNRYNERMPKKYLNSLRIINSNTSIEISRQNYSKKIPCQTKSIDKF